MSSLDEFDGIARDGSDKTDSEATDAEIKRQIEIANRIESALSFLRTTASKNEYFTGYSLNEILKDRIDLIGPTDDKIDTTVGDTEKFTLIAMLNKFLTETVGEGPKHEGGAIQSALDLDFVQNLSKDQTVAADDD